MQAFSPPDPPLSDGTTFWQSPKGKQRGDWSKGGDIKAGWKPWHHVPARFNRMVIFDSDLFHSRSIFENYGEGDEARLIQVMFIR